MVSRGYGLNDLRKLYIDEFFEYYKATLKVMEMSGLLPEGTTPDDDDQDDDALGSLKNQLTKFKL